MKSFFKLVLANVVGIMVFIAISVMFLVFSIVSSLLSSSSTTTVQDNSVFVLTLNGELVETDKSDPMFEQMFTLMNNETPKIALNDIIANIKKAAKNDNIKGIFLDCQGFMPDSYASLEEIRRALTDFKKSGKWIVAYSEGYSTPTYYLASVAESRCMHEQGMIEWMGLAACPMFLKDALAKFGVKFTVTKVGKYKSAPEMYASNSMSEPNREQITAYLNGLWGSIVKDVALATKISEKDLNLYADSLITFDDPKTYVQRKLITNLTDKKGVKDLVRKKLNIADDKAIHTVSMTQMNELPEADEDGDDEIAIYYASGEILDDPTPRYKQADEIVGNDVADDLDELAKDDNVKAVVLRVNSPGGSAFASEIMFQAVKRLKAKKPVVVSMGGMAASGGYYMSCGANKIFAENTTLTGSIGIFGMFPDYSELLTDKLGVHFDVIKTNAHSDMGNMGRSISQEEIAFLNRYVERGYDLFLSRVAEGRKMKKEQVHEVAQGRVWLGCDALKIKLVDEIGGIDKAVAEAAKLAKTKSYYTANYPGKADMTADLFATKVEKSILDERMQMYLTQLYGPFGHIAMQKRLYQWLPTPDQNKLQARIPFILNIEAGSIK